MVHDEKEPQCVGCKNKLMGVHLSLVTWFWDMKSRYPELHVAWGFRGEADQKADFAAGRSRLQWPRSKHNHELNGNPCAMALDVFTIDPMTGAAKFNPDFYHLLNEASKALGYKLRWGGEFVHLKDLDHWELPNELA